MFLKGGIAMFALLLVGVALAACSSTLVPTVSAEATQNPTSLSTQLPTPTQVEWAIVPTTLDQPGAWPIYDLADPTLPELFHQAERGYAINSSWQPDSVRYVYHWGGLGGGIYNSQSLLLGRDGIYYLNGKGIETELVDNLVSALKNLHPISTALAFIDHTDDYPTWILDLRGADGTYIEISSDSSATWEAEPWIVSYNGRMYAQYDGSLGPVIHEIFDSSRGQPFASFSAGGGEENHTYFSTLDNYYGPGPLKYNGLTQLYGIFIYALNFSAGGISGEVTNYALPQYEDDWGYGILYLENLTGVRIQDRENWLDCQIVHVPPEDDSYDPARWDFDCPELPYSEGDIYHIPIEVKVVTLQSETHTYTGELYGAWGEAQHFVYTGFPEELQEALLSYPDAAQMFEDHLPFSAAYVGGMPVGDFASVASYGQVYFLGQADVAGERIVYTIGTPFRIEDGQLVLWELDRGTLTTYLEDALTHAFTRRVVAENPDTIVNLFYAEPHPNLIREYIFLEVAPTSIFYSHSSSIMQCGSLPGRGEYPSSKDAYRGLGFNSARIEHSAEEFLVIGNEIIANDFTISFIDTYGDLHGVESSVLPTEFSDGEFPPFRRFSISRSSNFSQPPNTIEVSYPLDLQPDDEQVYLSILENLAGRILPHDYYENAYVIFGTLAINALGETEFVSCSP